PGQSELEGDPSGRHAGMRARRGPAVDQAGIGRASSDQAVVVVVETEIDATGNTAQAIWRHAGILQRLPRDLEHQPLLRVHLHRFARCDAEEGAVELVDILEEAARGLRGFAGLVTDPFAVITTLRRYRRHGVARFDEQAPERAAVGCT